MARITSRQAQELMDAYAKVYETKEEPAVETPVNETPVEDIQEGPLDAIPMTRSRQNRQNRINALRTDLSTSGGSTNGKTRTVSNLNKTGTAKEVGSAGGSAAGSAAGGGGTAKVAGSAGGSSGGGLTTLSGRPSRLSGRAQQAVLNMRKDANDAGVKPNEGPSTVSKVNSTGTAQKVGNQSSGGSTGGGGSRKVDGKALMNKLKADSGDKVQSGGGGQSTGGQKPQRGTPVNQLFGKGGSDGSPAPYTGGPDAAQRANAGNQKPAAQGGGQQQQPVKTVGGQGNRQRPVKTGGIQAGKAIRGGLGRLGALAGRAVGAAKSAAGNVGAAAGRAAGAVASGAKSAAGAVASGAKRVAGGVADAATGNMTDFDKRGGKPQGVARVVAGGIDKLTGDRTDLDKRGVTPLNAGQRAQQQKPAPGKPAPQAQAKPAATRPVQGQQPAAKPVLSNNSPAAKAGIPLNMRQAAADKNAKFQAARKSGNMAQYRKENPKLSGADRAKAMAKQRIAAKKSAPAQPVQRKVTSVMDMEGYDNVFDDTVKFLVSEGHAKDVSEAMSIMSESEFIDAFNQELNG